MPAPSARVIAIIGPTGSGKSAAAIAVAHATGGAVIGADSRQVYRGLNLCSGKEPGRVVTRNIKRATQSAARLLNTPYVVDGINHYMIDIVSPRTDYDVAKFCDRAGRIIRALRHEGILPIVCGGTHFWVQALLEGQTFAVAAPNRQLRTTLAHLDTGVLLRRLVAADPTRAAAIIAKGESANRHRLIRAIEIVESDKQETQNGKCKEQDYYQLPTVNCQPTIIAIVPPMDALRDKIAARLDARLAAGMIDEVAHLHYEAGVPWTRLASFGLEPRWCTAYLRGEVSHAVMRERLILETGQFAKRQLTWIRRWQRQGTRIATVADAAAAADVALRTATRTTDL